MDVMVITIDINMNVLITIVVINMDIMVITTDNKMDITYNPGCEGAVKRIHLTQDMIQWLSLLNALMRLQVPYKAGN
jgi:hypothetical protein